MQNLHIKLGFSEALNSKKVTLSSEINFLSMEKNFQEYKKLRQAEAEKKSALKAGISAFLKEIDRLELLLPKTKMPEAERKKFAEEISETAKKSGLESELRQIQERLKALQ